MNENLNNRGKRLQSPERRAFFRKIAEGASLITVGGVAGYFMGRAMKGSVSKEKPKILPKIPDRVKDDLIAVDKRTWMSKGARKFLDDNNDSLKFNTRTGILTVKVNRDTPIERVEIIEPENKLQMKEIRLIASSDGFTLGVYYLNEGGKSGTSITVRLLPNTEFEIENYDF